MFLLYVLCIIAVAARGPTYTRTYLRDQKRIADEKQRLEDEEYHTQLVIKGVEYIETSIFDAASRGETKYSPPFNGCYGNPKDIKTCELVVPRIRAVITQRFPDSEISYDKTTGTYIMYW